jgi:cysteine desulfurase
MNLPGIAGFGEAARLMIERRRGAVPIIAALACRLIEGICGGVPGTRILGDSAARAPGIAVIAVEGVRSEVLLHALEMRGVLASSGAACHSRRAEPALCLREAGLSSGEGSLRLSLSADTTSEEIDRAIAAFAGAVADVRAGRAGG